MVCPAGLSPPVFSASVCPDCPGVCSSQPIVSPARVFHQPFLVSKKKFQNLQKITPLPHAV
jgi:hypothetical protein